PAALVPSDLSKVISFRPAAEAKAARYASAHAFGDAWRLRVRSVRPRSSPPASGRNPTRSSAHHSSYTSQAPAIVLTSLPMTASVVKSRRKPSCVKRQKRNCSSSVRSNHYRADSACAWRSHARASQTLTSRKFNEFIDPLAGELDLGSFGANER